MQPVPFVLLERSKYDDIAFSTDLTTFDASTLLLSMRAIHHFFCTRAVVGIQYILCGCYGVVVAGLAGDEEGYG